MYRQAQPPAPQASALSRWPLRGCDPPTLNCFQSGRGTAADVNDYERGTR